MNGLTIFTRSCVLALFSAILLSTANGQDATATPLRFDSPRIAALWEAVQHGDQAATEKFWADVKDKAPLQDFVEYTPPRNNGDRWVTFLWKGDQNTKKVILHGGPPVHLGTNDGDKPLARLPQTDVWYRTEREPMDARFTYFFEVVQVDPATGAISSKNRLDSLNPRLREVARERISVLELDLAPAQSWVQKRKDAPEGKLTDQQIHSDILNEDRPVTIYTPAGYASSNEPLNVIVLLDGENYVSSIPVPVILDNLIAAHKIAPTIAVLIASNTKDAQGGAMRTRDYTCNDHFAYFVAKELMPWVRQHYRASANPARNVIGGASLGGLAAAYLGFKYPGVFGNVLSQSGSWFYFPGWPAFEANHATQTGWLTSQFARSPKKPLKFFLETGTYEGQGVMEVRRARDVLIARGYDVTYHEFNGGHERLNWQGSFSDGVIALIGNDRAKEGKARLPIGSDFGSWRNEERSLDQKTLPGASRQ